MALEYVNRRGDRYFVRQGTTKTGKPKFYCTKQKNPSGEPVEQLPQGYCIHESPRNGQVSVRKIRPSRIAPIERDLLERWSKELAASQVIVDIEGDSLVVYGSDVNAEESSYLMSLMTGLPVGRRNAQRDWFEKMTTYSPTLRFTLSEEEERLFWCERWCYLGRIDDWMPITGSAQDLETLARKFLPHVGQESFFELM